MVAFYDEITYPGAIFEQTHPNRLATIATLHGLSAPNLETCRVLELGCGVGLNLIAIALAMPKANCVGIDLSANEIRQANALKNKLGLVNVQFEQADILSIQPDFGLFDYIIAHGVYSWVPTIVRDKLISICRENLTLNGVAYISYNAYPGAYFRDITRKLMLFHSKKFDNTEQKFLQSRAILEFVVEDVKNHGDATYHSILQTELDRIRNYSDGFLCHDDLAENNASVYFSEFAAHAIRYQLQYISEANYHESQTNNLPPYTLEVLNAISNDIISKEQYLDFLKCRRFRQTLLCRAENTIDRTTLANNIENFYVGSSLQPEYPHLPPATFGKTNFVGPENKKITLDNPLIKTALTRLAVIWPNTIHFGNLLDHVVTNCKVNNHDKKQSSKMLAEMLLSCYASALIEFDLKPVQFVSEPGEFPVGYQLARVQSETNDSVTNLRHAEIKIEDPITRKLLQLADGKRNRTALIDEISAWIVSNQINLPILNPNKQKTDEIRYLIDQQLTEKLSHLAKNLLLIA